MPPERLNVYPRVSMWALLCSGLFLLCVLVAQPWTAMPILDDWSYAHIAEGLMRTGHIVYDGWATPIVGWELYAGALVFKLFGVSYTAARMVSLATGVATAYVLQRLLVRVGISERNAALGSCVLLLSPIFMQLSVTYMTDIEGMFALVLCFYACVRAAEASDDARAGAWLAFAALGNYVFGSCRQIAWLGVLIVVPSALWLFRRRRRRALAIGVAAELIAVALVFATLRWFAHQPYSQSEAVRFHPRTLPFGHMAFTLVDAVLEVFFLVLPLLLAFVPSCRSRKLWLTVVALLVVVSGAAIFAAHRHRDMMLAPYLQNWYTRFGNMNVETPIQQPPPVVLTTPWVIVLNVAFGVGLVFAAGFLLRLRKAGAEGGATLRLDELWTLLLPFSVVYMLLLVPRSAESLADRYCLPLALVCVIALLRLWQDAERRELPLVAVIATAVIALFSVGATHDLFAYYRAKNVAVNELLSAGVPKTAIDGGWDYDGATELEHAAYINSERILTPKDAYHFKATPDPQNCFLPAFFDLFPHVEPRYGVRMGAHECLGAVPGYAPVSYTRWLGPRKPGTFYVVRYSDTR